MNYRVASLLKIVGRARERQRKRGKGIETMARQKKGKRKNEKGTKKYEVKKRNLLFRYPIPGLWIQVAAGAVVRRLVRIR